MKNMLNNKWNIGEIIFFGNMTFVLLSVLLAVIFNVKIPNISSLIYFSPIIIMAIILCVLPKSGLTKWLRKNRWEWPKFKGVNL